MLTPFIFLIGCGTDDDSEGILFPEKNQFIFNDTIRELNDVYYYEPNEDYVSFFILSNQLEIVGPDDDDIEGTGPYVFFTIEGPNVFPDIYRTYGFEDENGEEYFFNDDFDIGIYGLDVQYDIIEGTILISGDSTLTNINFDILDEDNISYNFTFCGPLKKF